jgi:hypothetical protein
MLTGMLHTHVSSWLLGIILFFVSYFLLKKGNIKGQKVTHMVLRLFYVLIIVSGGTIVTIITAESGFPPVYATKAIIGLWVIFMMEWILTKGKKGIYKSIYWFLLVLALALVFFYGYIIL